jgi:UDP-glucose 4-epimerase
MPLICKVALKQLEKLSVYGSEYDTRDGTGVRDYIDIMDLIDGHISALNFLNSSKMDVIRKSTQEIENYQSFNLGTGHGYSVLELINAFEEVSGIKIPYEFEHNRPGDIAECYAKNDKANKLLNWNSKRSLHDMCMTSWRFIS